MLRMRSLPLQPRASEICSRSARSRFERLKLSLKSFRSFSAFMRFTTYEGFSLYLPSKCFAQPYIKSRLALKLERCRRIAYCVMPATSSWPGLFGRIISTAKNRSRYRGRIWRGRFRVDEELRKLMSQELDEIFDKAHRFNWFMVELKGDLLS